MVRPKGITKVFIKAIAGVECSLPFITFLDADIVISSVEVDLQINLCLVKSIKHIIDEWDWVAVLHSDLIEALVIDAELQRTILFLGKYYGCSHLGARGAYEALFQHIIDIGAECL